MNQENHTEENPRNKDDSILFNRIKIAIREHDVENIENRINQAFKEDKKRINFSFRIAASLLILIIISVSFFLIIQPQNNRVFHAYYAPYRSDQITGIYRDNESEKNIAVYLYSKSDYNKALPLFSSYLKEKPGDSQVRLLLAICLMEENRPEEARIELEEIIHSDNGFFKADAHWYLTLLYVKQGNYGSALESLEKISDSANYSDRVASLKIQIARYQKNR
jgi:predicted Zn-dependent protease